MDNHTSESIPPVRITKPESAELIDRACVRIKREISQLQAIIEGHPHDEERTEALTYCAQAHQAFQALQSFIISK